MKKLGLVLLSGGLDSTTVASLALMQGYELQAVTLDYGQSHRRELDAARQVAQRLGIQHRVIKVSFYRDLAWYSALTNAERFTLPVDRAPENMGGDIPLTYVPMRNTFFLTLGAALLESEALAAIEHDGISPTNLTATLFIAANALDYSGYPDCRPEYYQSVAETLHLGSKLGSQYHVPMRIETPIIDKSKADIVRLAHDLHAPIDLTWSCYQGGERPCGRCDSCQLRARGFDEAGLPDSALVNA